MDRKKYQELAEFLINAEKEKREVVRLTSEIPDLTPEQAYRIQEELVNLKLANGHRIIGPKMGLTSFAKMQQMKVNEPIYGYVLDNMLVESGGSISLSEFIHPKVEIEIAFFLGEDIEGHGVTSAQVMSATAYVAPALEIIDSRYKNFQFTLPDVIADNASASRVVIGNKLTPLSSLTTDLELIGAVLYINGELKANGAGAAILNHPANSIAALANMLARSGKKLQAGDIILAGAITEAIMLANGDVVHGKLDQLGDVSFAVRD
ncbi:2-keto-4-pentenoate hydratase [Bacillus smithii]|uniref:2-keto-4-pentenoate hydratase n=1 Tax=Bacillus smithii TaxID=1479 RepID=UPI002E201D98|nr:fumarylacetoacetate hydrolase family protein [Bacillus smithii]MED1456989.1 fumarylacetoacetate hydrolase family protein [Bacillus smithii]